MARLTREQAQRLGKIVASRMGDEPKYAISRYYWFQAGKLAWILTKPHGNVWPDKGVEMFEKALFCLHYAQALEEAETGDPIFIPESKWGVIGEIWDTVDRESQEALQELGIESE